MADRRRPAAETAARELAKRGLRAYGTATASWRARPDFLLVGAKRGGTTSLWRYLTEHPDVLRLFPRRERIKGLYYFDERYALGDRWYGSHFPTRAQRSLRSRGGRPAQVGEASPYYLYHPLAPTRAAAALPDARILVVLRDPVERAYSHWKERRSNDGDPLGFAEAIDAEEGRLAGEEARILMDPGAVSTAHRHWSYLDQGRYAPMLERWFAAFGRERVLVEVSEDRRKELIKVARGETEHSRVAIRNVRRDSNEAVKKLLKDKLISEDDDRRAHEEIQKLTDGYMGKVDALSKAKEKDILEVK